MDFGTRLKELRVDNDLKQDDIGKIINISGRMVGYYEKGKHIPRDSASIIRLAQYFNVSTDYLFGLTKLRNYDELSGILKAYKSLPQEGQKELIDYLKYLKTKYKK